MLHSRKERLEGLIKEEVAKILDQLKDPRKGMVTVNAVKLTKDLRLATIYVSVREDERIKKTMRVLEQARGFIKRELASRVILKYLPDIQFKYDESIQRAARIEELFLKIDKEKEIPQNKS